MHIVILNAGVIGVTSAWYLAKAGHKVTVIDRQPAPALETSFANAGEISPGYASAWAASGIPIKAVKWPFAMRLPVYPVKGYSITAPIIDEAKSPISTVMDEPYKIAVTRLGTRIRVGRMAEISGFNNTLHERRKATLQHSVEDLFGGAADQSKATFWSGLRPMTPDGTPMLGALTVPNLWLNTDHGTLGWTMAAGSGRMPSNLISGKKADIKIEDLNYAR